MPGARTLDRTSCRCLSPTERNTVKKKAKTQKKTKVTDLEPKSANPKGGAFSPTFRGGVNVAVGDFNGDGTVETTSIKSSS